MRESDVRGLCWILTTALCLPAVIFALRGYTALIQLTGVAVPGWLNAILNLCIFGCLYVGAGYLVAWGLGKRYPDSRPGTIPDPTRNGQREDTGT